MSLHRFLAEIRGAEMHCSITSDGPLNAPIFCFSLMAPPEVVSGGTLIRTDGGYGEVQLPDIKAGMTHHFILRYANPTYKPKNRAWLPLGAYLRCGEDIVELPKLPAGVTTPAPGPCPRMPASSRRGERATAWHEPSAVHPRCDGSSGLRGRPIPARR